MSDDVQENAGHCGMINLETIITLSILILKILLKECNI